MARLYSLGIQTFERLRRENRCYVDKTDLVYQLVHDELFSFLGRPRRFGKSLLLSTLKSYFEGRKDLFKGLAIEGLETEWVQHPVFHMDLSGATYDRPEALENLLHVQLTNWETLYGASTSAKTIEERFKAVIERAYKQTGQMVVLLIDEYEAPVLDAIGDPELQEAYRKQLHGFYRCIKPSEPFLKFVLFTGVTKIGHLSVFSALNSLTDLSLAEPYATICGVTEKELRQNFESEIQALADVNAVSLDEMYAQLKKQYDGYHFAMNADGVYNPFSLISALKYRKLRSYWFSTGTPTYLAEVLKQKRCPIDQFNESRYTEEELSEIDSMRKDASPLLYQSGYLTLKAYDPKTRKYQLGFPNQEVEEGLINFFIPFYMTLDRVSDFNVDDFASMITAGDAKGFLNGIMSLMADTSYEIIRDLEVHVQNFCYLLFKLLGCRVSAEYHTSTGRIDLVLQTENYIYIIEFKCGHSAEEALKQIKDNAYTAPYRSDPRKKFLIGVNYSLKTRGPGEYLIEEA